MTPERMMTVNEEVSMRKNILSVKGKVFKGAVKAQVEKDEPLAQN